MLSDGRKISSPWCLIHSCEPDLCASAHDGGTWVCWKGVVGCTYGKGMAYRDPMHPPRAEHVCSTLRDLEDLGQQIVDLAPLRHLLECVHDAAIGFALWHTYLRSGATEAIYKHSDGSERHYPINWDASAWEILYDKDITNGE